MFGKRRALFKRVDVFLLSGLLLQRRDDVLHNHTALCHGKSLTHAISHDPDGTHTPLYFATHPFVCARALSPFCLAEAARGAAALLPPLRSALNGQPGRHVTLAAG